MSAARLVAGVDAGGSHTEIVVLDSSGTERLRDRGEASNVQPAGEVHSAGIIMELLRGAARRVGGSGIDALVVGAAGAGQTTIQEALTAQLRRLGAPEPTRVVTDAETAYASAFGSEPGMLLLSGTGSIAVARDVAGGWHRVGGLGWRFGDEGSGFWLGSTGVRAAGQAAERRGPATVLTATLADAARVPDALALVRSAQRAEPRAVAALAAVVQQAAAEGDAVATAIVRQASLDLWGHVEALLTHLPGDGTVSLVLGGGVLRAGNPLRAVLAEVLAERAPRIQVLDRPLDAAHGAATLALQLLDSLA